MLHEFHSVFDRVQDWSLAPYHCSADCCAPFFTVFGLVVMVLLIASMVQLLWLIIYYGCGSILQGCGRKILASSPLMAEAMAAWEACYLVKRQISQPKFIFSDSKMLVDLCNGPTILLGRLVQQCRTLEIFWGVLIINSFL